MRNAPTPGDNTIDSRDVIARIEELEGERELLAEDVQDCDSEYDNAARVVLSEWDNDNGDELASLQALAEEAEGCSDWQYGAQLIADAYFEDYARDLVTDIGDMPRDLPLYLVIDWSATADNIQEDYTSVDFGGETYWLRY